MSTYRLRGASLIGSIHGGFRMPLACEQCHETLGIVTVEEEHDGLSAAEVARHWPSLAPRVASHEAFCPLG